jgi:acyl carrier protein
MATATLDEVKAIIRTQMGLGRVNDGDRIVEDLGAESADIANIIAAVEDKYGVSVPDAQIKSISTVSDVLKVVSGL